MTNANSDSKDFILSQLEEALEERQTSDRRQNAKPLAEGFEDRRKGDRRTLAQQAETA